jgi:hypothetical protein
MNSKSKWMQKERKKRISRGLCATCGKYPIASRSKSRCDKCLKVAYESSKLYKATHAEQTRMFANKYAREYSRKLRMQAIQKIAQENSLPLVCPICGCKVFKLLTIDHINHDGGGNRRNSNKIYRDILNGATNIKTLRILCIVCNFADYVMSRRKVQWLISFQDLSS